MLTLHTETLRRLSAPEGDEKRVLSDAAGTCPSDCNISVCPVDACPTKVVDEEVPGEDPKPKPKPKPKTPE